MEYSQGRISVLPLMKIPEGVVGFGGTSRGANMAGGFRGNPDKLLPCIRAAQERGVCQDGFCLVEVWGFHQVCAHGRTCACVHSNGKHVLQTHHKISASE